MNNGLLSPDFIDFLNKSLAPYVSKVLDRSEIRKQHDSMSRAVDDALADSVTPEGIAFAIRTVDRGNLYASDRDSHIVQGLIPSIPDSGELKEMLFHEFGKQIVQNGSVPIVFSIVSDVWVTELDLLNAGEPVERKEAMIVVTQSIEDHTHVRRSFYDRLPGDKIVVTKVAEDEGDASLGGGMTDVFSSGFWSGVMWALLDVMKRNKNTTLEKWWMDGSKGCLSTGIMAADLNVSEGVPDSFDKFLDAVAGK